MGLECGGGRENGLSGREGGGGNGGWEENRKDGRKGSLEAGALIKVKGHSGGWTGGNRNQVNNALEAAGRGQAEREVD